MKRMLAIAVAVTTLSAFAVPVSAEIITFGGLLTPGQEVPTPTIPTGFNPLGTALSKLDTDTKLLTTDLAWFDLTTNLRAAHIHNSGGNPTGPVIIPFINPPDPTRPQNGSANFVMTLTDTQYNSLISGLQSGFIYFNLHTVLNPSGEIRANVAAQTVPIPEPSAYALVGMGALGLLGFGWRHRKMVRAWE